jgi:hypothetical protein
MNDWLHNLTVPWMGLVIFGFTYLLAAAIYAGVAALASGERGRSFKSMSPGMLPSLSIVFGLFVAFTAAQVWADSDRAGAAVSREASALRSAAILAASLPGETEKQLRGLIRGYVEEAATVEWPLMAARKASLNATPRQLAEALRLVLTLATAAPGQETAQRQITTAIETALDARRQRIIISRSAVNFVKWCCLYLQAACVLLAIAILHCDDRLASLVAIGLFATGVSASVLLIAAHDRPFTGQISVSPEPLLQIMPRAPEDR